MKKTKIFGIGLSRTGTSSLTFALRILGHTTIHFPKDPITMAEKFDALTDTTVARDYKKLDKSYPNSKFILTIREIDDWLNSIKAHFNRNSAETREKWVLDLRRDVYHTADFNLKLMRDSYLKHINDVKHYFKDRPKDLLIMNICDGEKWEVLCPFLDERIPDDAFPRINVKETNDN